MIIKKAIELTKGLSLICTNKEKDYKFISSIEQGKLTSCDYIYIPLLESNENVFDELEKHLKNPNCKGFYFKKDILKNPNQQIYYHNIIKKYSSKIEVVVLVRNPFNSGYEIGQENVKTFNPKIVSIAGTDEKNVVLNLVSYVLSSTGTTISSRKNATAWQKFIEPMLLIDKDTKYCVIELSAEKKDIYKCARVLENNTIIFTKTSLNFLNRYNDKEEFINEIAYCTEMTDNIENIFTFEENDLVNNSIKTNKINIIEENEIKTEEKISNKKKCLRISYKDISITTTDYSYYTPRCFVISYLALKSLGLNENDIQKKFSDYKDTSAIYEKTKLSNNNHIVMSTQDHTFYSIKNAIKQFSLEYSEFKKIIILSKIDNLGNYSDDIHKEILKDLAKEKFNTVVLINLNEFESNYKIYDKKAYVKRFVVNKNTNYESFSINLNLFLEGQINDNTAVLVCIPSNMNLNSLFALTESYKCATT